MTDFPVGERQKLVLSWAVGGTLVLAAALILIQLYLNAELYPINRRSWGNDFAFFFRAAQALRLDQPLYQERWFTSPPPAAWFFVPLTWLTFPAAYTTFFVATVGCCFGSCFLLSCWFFGEDRETERRVRFATILVMLLGFPFQFLVERGNTDGIVLLMITLALWTTKRSEPLGGILIGVAGAIKLYPLLLLGVLLAQRRWKAAAAGFATIVVLTLITFQDWMDFVHRFQVRDQGFRIDENASLANTMFYLIAAASPEGAPISDHLATQLGKYAFLLLLATLLWLDWRRPGTNARDASAHLFLYAPLMVSFPNLVHNYELVFAVAALPAFCWLQQSSENAGPRLGPVIFGLGLTLSQFQSVAFQKLTHEPHVQALPGLGLVLMLVAIILVKATRPVAAPAVLPEAQPA